jgi:hypothetical protein
MRPLHYDPQALQRVFERRQIATLPELKAALGTEVSMTIFRKLAPLAYLTSYSHRGAYYTLESIAQFDAQVLALSASVVLPPRHSWTPSPLGRNGAGRVLCRRTG